MAPTTTLPPQAYTREILSKAYLWAQTQPESIRKLAATPDALVGLFLRAQRNGDVSLETTAPVSRDNFISDLKSLASELEQFEGPPSGGQFQNVKTTHTQTVTNYVPPTPQPQPQQQYQSQQYHQPPPRTVAEVVQAQPAPAPMPQKMIEAPTTYNVPASTTLDSKSLEMVQEVRRQLNLTSEAEVLRLLIVLGYERARGIFPGK